MILQHLNKSGRAPHILLDSGGAKRLPSHLQKSPKCHQAIGQTPSDPSHDNPVRSNSSDENVIADDDSLSKDSMDSDPSSLSLYYRHEGCIFQKVHK